MTDTTLDGATDPGPELAWPANAGEFAARWNASTAERRERLVAQMVEAAERAARCYQVDHDGLARQLSEAARAAAAEYQRGWVDALAKVLQEAGKGL